MMELRPDAELTRHVNKKMREQELKKIENERKVLLHDIAISRERLTELNIQKQNIVMK